MQGCTLVSLPKKHVLLNRTGESATASADCTTVGPVLGTVSNTLPEYNYCTGFGTSIEECSLLDVETGRCTASCSS